MAETTRLLVVENDIKEAEVYNRLISEVTSAHVDITQSMAAALELLNRNSYQTVILDSATVKDVFSALERIKALNPSISVILVSAMATIDEAVKVTKLGTDNYFKKPVNPDHFKLAVRHCLDQRALFTGDAQLMHFMNLLNACQLVSASLDEQRVFETVMTYLKRETQSKGIGLYRYKDSQWNRVPLTAEENVDVLDSAVEWSKILTKAYDEKEPFKILPKSRVGPELLAMHFHCVGESEYYIVCASPLLKDKADEFFSRCKMLHAQVQVTGKNIQNYMGVRDLLYTDDATGLYNARYLSLCLDKVFEMQKAKSSSFAVLFIDVDHFKSVNDKYGHLYGTRLLYEIGKCIKGQVRLKDVVCRYGGDEFVAILYGADVKTGQEIAERIRAHIEGFQFLEKENINAHLTVSIGIAVCPEHAQSKRDIIQAADQAMYAAKRTTRNFVYVAESVVPPQMPKRAA